MPCFIYGAICLLCSYQSYLFHYQSQLILNYKIKQEYIKITFLPSPFNYYFSPPSSPQFNFLYSICCSHGSHFLPSSHHGSFSHDRSSHGRAGHAAVTTSDSLDLRGQKSIIHLDLCTFLQESLVKDFQERLNPCSFLTVMLYFSFSHRQLGPEGSLLFVHFHTELAPSKTQFQITLPQFFNLSLEFLYLQSDFGNVFGRAVLTQGQAELKF